jgi:hypothetical protein
MEYVKIHSLWKREGIVARAEPTVYFESGAPVIFKLKCKDFEVI